MRHTGCDVTAKSKDQVVLLQNANLVYKCNKFFVVAGYKRNKKITIFRRLQKLQDTYWNMIIWSQSYDRERQRCKNLQHGAFFRINVIFPFWKKRPSLQQRWRCSCKFLSRRIGSWFYLCSPWEMFWDLRGRRTRGAEVTEASPGRTRPDSGHSGGVLPPELGLGSILKISWLD
jgi:hypothetical protein